MQILLFIRVMSGLFECLEQSAQNGKNSSVLLILEYVMHVIPGVGATLTHQPTLIELNADLNAAYEIVHGFFAQAVKPRGVLEPLSVRVEIALDRLGLVRF